MTDDNESQNKTFRLGAVTLKILETLHRRFNKEAGFNISYGKIIEIALFRMKDKKLSQLLNEVSDSEKT